MTATLNGQSSAPTFSLATLREVLAEMSEADPGRTYRLIKAANIVAVRRIERGEGAGWWVQSECDPTKEYWVFADRCTCQGYKQRGGPCMHALAVRMLLACERKEAERNDPTLVPFPERAYTDQDRFELTPQGYATLATIDTQPLAYANGAGLRAGPRPAPAGQGRLRLGVQVRAGRVVGYPAGPERERSPVAPAAPCW